MQHSLIPPSSAHIWGKPNGCTGWVRMALQYPETDPDPEAANGEASHEIGAALIHQAARGLSTFSPAGFVGGLASNGVVMTEEMFDGAALYARDVQAVMQSEGVFGGDNLGIEQRLEIPRVHSQSFGTPDCYLFARPRNRLYVWDYKFGHGIVEALENWQALNYLPGILDRLGIDGYNDRNLQIHVRIIQPRAYHRDGPVREWILTGAELRAYVNVLAGNAAEALSSKAMCRTGEQCHHCQARANCDTAIRAGLQLYEVASAPTPIDLSAASAGLLYSIVKRARKQCEYIETALEEQIKARTKRGEIIPGWMPEPAFGREKWAKPIHEVAALGELFGIDLRKPENAITPVQARAKGIPDEVVRAYSETPRSGIKLAPDNASKIKQVFSK